MPPHLLGFWLTQFVGVGVGYCNPHAPLMALCGIESFVSHRVAASCFSQCGGTEAWLLDWLR